METIFKKIIDKKIPSEIVFENDLVLAIKDISPQAPVHLLIIPKKEIACLQDVEPSDLPLIQEVIRVAQILAEQFGVEDNYRFLTNNGEWAGQTVFHLHFHLIGGRVLGSMA